MSDFFSGYLAGESMARCNDAAGEFADAVTGSFRQLGQQHQLSIQVAQAQRSAAVGRAALTGVADAVALLSPAARAEFETAMNRAFEGGYRRAAATLGLELEAGSPLIEASHRSILRRR